MVLTGNDIVNMVKESLEKHKKTYFKHMHYSSTSLSFAAKEIIATDGCGNETIIKGNIYGSYVEGRIDQISRIGDDFFIKIIGTSRVLFHYSDNIYHDYINSLIQLPYITFIDVIFEYDMSKIEHLGERIFNTYENLPKYGKYLLEEDQLQEIKEIEANKPLPF